MALELPQMDPCLFCEGIAGRIEDWLPIEETPLTISALTPSQFEVGQCFVIPRRHAPTLLDLTPDESAAIIESAKRLAQAMIAALHPLGILLYQNNGVWSGQEVPHFHLHVVPRQPGSEWGVGPPQVARLEAAERNPRRPPPLEARRVTAEQLRTHLS
jgi:histidine triad (HIT) family protein